MQKCGEKFNVQYYLQKLKQGSFIPLPDFTKLCDKAKQILSEEPNLVRISAPIVVCSDPHGQIQDLLQVFNLGGWPPDINYLFLGNYVNRGQHSVQTLTLLLLLKIMFPARVTLLRGNHQSRYLTQTYGFYDESVKKYGSSQAWKISTELFDFLPLAAIVSDKIYGVHSGLSPEINRADAINKIYRFYQVPHQGPIFHMLWSSPQDRPGYNFAPKSYQIDFGPDITKEFNHINELDMIIRGHELKKSGFEITHEGQLATVFSAPNYSSHCVNLAAILFIDEHLTRDFVVFEPSPKINPK